MQYLNFDLEIGPGQNSLFPVTVRLPAGAVQGTLQFPFDQHALKLYLSKLENALLRSRTVRRQVVLPKEQAIREFGSGLFEALFTGDVRTLYDQQHARARQQGMGVRLRLLVEAPELATLPWEYLLDPRQPDFLCLSPQTPLVRYVKLPQPQQPLTVQSPLRILGMISSPSSPATPPLDVEGEQTRLTEALAPLEAQGVVHLDWVSGQTWQALQQKLWEGWHVFHFIGHGAFNPNTDEGMLALTDPAGKPHLLPGSQLGRMLANGSLRLVVLNACEGAKGSDRDLFSSAGASLVRREIPAVVAMQAEISDDAALEFTRTFYKALASGMPVDAAMGEARTAIWIRLPNTLEWGTPVLYLRAPDGVLFDLTGPSEPKQARTPSPKEQPEPEQPRILTPSEQRPFSSVLEERIQAPAFLWSAETPQPSVPLPYEEPPPGTLSAPSVYKPSTDSWEPGYQQPPSTDGWEPGYQQPPSYPGPQYPLPVEKRRSFVSRALRFIGVLLVVIFLLAWGYLGLLSPNSELISSGGVVFLIAPVLSNICLLVSALRATTTRTSRSNIIGVIAGLIGGLLLVVLIRANQPGNVPNVERVEGAILQIAALIGLAGTCLGILGALLP